MKDNFDIQKFLVENKLTENSRGDEGRYHFDGSQKNTGCARILTEMHMPVEAYGDHHDPEYTDDVPEGPYDSQRDLDFDRSIDECGPELGISLNEAEGDLENLKSLVQDYREAFADSGIDVNTIPDSEYQGFIDMYDEDGTSLSSLGSDEMVAREFLNYVLDGLDNLDEAGYTDDEEDSWTDPDTIGDDDGGASLLDLVKGDKKAKAARKAAAKDTAEDPAMADDEPVVPADEPDLDDPDSEEDVTGDSIPDAEAQPGLSAQIKAGPTVEMMMDPQELDQYLSGFRRPQVAVNVLNRAIRATQSEVNDSIGISSRGCLYIVLGNGAYHSSAMQDRYKDERGSWQEGQTIAKVRPDMEWRKKNFGD